MKIEQVPYNYTLSNFEAIEIGDVFMFNSCLLMKIGNCLNSPNCINLKNGGGGTLKAKDTVTLVDATINYSYQ